MLPPQQVLEGDVIGVDDLDPTSRLAQWVLTTVHPAHCAVVRVQYNLLSVQVTLGMLQSELMRLFISI